MPDQWATYAQWQRFARCDGLLRVAGDGRRREVALPVGLALWHYRSLKKATDFPVSLRDICKLTGMSRCTARRGLLALDGAGLIARTDTAGRKPRVLLLVAFATD
jgi:hypothetical protein